MPDFRRKIALPQGKIGQAFEAVKAHLRTDGSDLKRWVNLWQLGDGLDSDDIQVKDWTLDQLPALRLDMTGDGASWFTEVVQKTRLHYAITIGVPSVKPTDATNALESLISRLWPGDKSLYRILKPLGVMSYSLETTGIVPIDHPSGRFQIVHARIWLNTEISTQY